MPVSHSQKFLWVVVSPLTTVLAFCGFPGVAPCCLSNATTLSNLADVLRVLRRNDEARDLLQRALTIDETTYGVSSAKVAARLLSLAKLLNTTDLTDEVAIVTEALSDGQPGSGSADSDVRLRDRLLSSIRATERWSPRTSGSRDVDDVIHVAGQADRDLHQSIVQACGSSRQRTSLGMLQTEQRDSAVERLTRGFMKEALVILEAVHGPDHPSVRQFVMSLEADANSVESEMLLKFISKAGGSLVAARWMVERAPDDYTRKNGLLNRLYDWEYEREKGKTR